ncbi:MAG TPA: hypothetical protein VGF28_03655 [Thermoanaerobaculia bacterium]
MLCNSGDTSSAATAFFTNATGTRRCLSTATRVSGCGASYPGIAPRNACMAAASSFASSW